MVGALRESEDKVSNEKFCSCDPRDVGAARLFPWEPDPPSLFTQGADMSMKPKRCV